MSMTKKEIFGVDTRIALVRVFNAVGEVVWRTNLRRHINRLIAEQGAKL